MNSALEQPPWQSERRFARLRSVRFSAIELLVALALLFFSAPFVQDLPYGDLVEAILVTLVMVSAVFAVGGRRRTLALALVLVAPVLIGKWLNHFYPEQVPPEFFLVGTIVFFCFVIRQLLRFVIQASYVDTNVLCAGIAGFLMVGFLWIPAYVLVAKLNPGAFTIPESPGSTQVLDGFKAFYFSFITLCTVGYGDITPASKAARMLAVTEAISGMFYMAVLVSRLVSVYSAKAPEGPAEVDRTGSANDARNPDRGRPGIGAERTGL